MTDRALPKCRMPSNGWRPGALTTVGPTTVKRFKFPQSRGDPNLDLGRTSAMSWLIASAPPADREFAAELRSLRGLP
jgi:hypothetical protein